MISRSSTARRSNGSGATSRPQPPKLTASRTQPGKSEIKRRYTVEHRYKNPGGFKIVLRLKKGNKIIAQANTQVQVRAGPRSVVQSSQLPPTQARPAERRSGAPACAVIGGGTVYQRPRPVMIAAPNPIVHAMNSTVRPIATSRNVSGAVAGRRDVDEPREQRRAPAAR